MNKDLDERLVPKNEYRDALNIDIATTEGSDIGSAQNSYGNLKVSSLGIAGGVCIGSILNPENQKAIWFISGTSVDAIAEFDQVADSVEPVLVDNHGGSTSFLNFDNDYLITGINVIDGLLFWTDNKNEPKKININRFMLGAATSNPFATTTKFVKEQGDGSNIVTGDNVLEEHITVIKKYPLQSPEMSLFRDAGGTTEPNTSSFTNPTNTSRRSGAEGNPFSAGATASSARTNKTTFRDTNAIINSTSITFDAQNAAGQILWTDVEVGQTLVLGNGNTVTNSSGNACGVQAKSANSITLTAAPATNIASGSTIGFRFALSNSQNLSFWKYKDSDGNIYAKPAGTCSDLDLYQTDDQNVTSVVVDENGYSIRIQKMVFQPRPNYKVGDIVVLEAPNTNTVNDSSDLVKIRLRLTGEETGFLISSSHGVQASTPYRKVFDVKILSIDPAIVSMNDSDLRNWTSRKETDTAIFEDRFVRFAYRWRYIDGEYSCISPFTSVGFLPTEGGYELDAEIGYNKNMRNTVSKIVLSDFELKPYDVERLEVLAKFSDSPSIYKLETINSSDLDSFVDLEITSDQLNAMLPSNQLLRAYDNVPKKAKAQEITANRLLYANYTQQYNLLGENPIFELSMREYTQAKGVPVKSIKSLRTYQLGVGLLDKYGRQTPVFSPSWVDPKVSSVSIEQPNSYTANSFFGSYNFMMPDWVTHLKYYIKEPKGEYYNITMDRIYQNTTEEFAWVSFPSSDINKVQEGDTIVLKKAHDSNGTIEVGVEPKYKILAKESVAPEAIRIKRKLIGRLENQVFGDYASPSTGYPIQGGIKIRIRGNGGVELNEAIKSAADSQADNRFLRIGSYFKNTVSDFYEIESIIKFDGGDGTTAGSADGDFADGVDYYEFLLKKPFGADISFCGVAPGDTGRAEYFELYEDQLKEYDEEFAGRFFVKVLKDDILQDYVINANSDNGLVYGIKSTEKIHWIQNVYTGDGTSGGGSLQETGLQGNVADSNRLGSDNSLNLSTLSDNAIGSFNGSLTDNNPRLHQIDGVANGGNVDGVVFKDYTYRGHNYLRISMNGINNLGIQRYAIDQAWAWKQWSNKPDAISSHNINIGKRKQMGHGFRLGEKHADFRLFNIGPGLPRGNGSGQTSSGYAFDTPYGTRRSLIENNFTLYKALSTVGAKFRFTIDPTETIYTITKSELIDINNYANFPGNNNDYNERSNQGVRWHLDLDKIIAWSPTHEYLSDLTTPNTITNGGFQLRPYDGSTKSDPENIDLNKSGAQSFYNGLSSVEKIDNRVEIQILQPITNSDTFSSKNPAVFEVQPKELADLNLYHETPNTVLVLKDDMFIDKDIVDKDKNIISDVFDQDTQIIIVTEPGDTLSRFKVKSPVGSSPEQKLGVPAGSTVTIYSKDTNGNILNEQKVLITEETNPANASTSTNFVTADKPNFRYKIALNWYNCYSYGNGVESDRIKDDFNAPTIDMGPRVSTTFEDLYKEETLGSGFIYSGIFNGKSGVNNLNQFIQAEKITKDLNPSYGTIQKLFTRNTNVIAFCEHKTLKILANKDALFNADGNPQLLSTNNVLGQAVPFAGEFGISKNPESFSSYGYRVYFSDKNRNAVLRLSNDGLTNIAAYGMSTFFKENLSDADNVVGSYDEDKDTYNLTFNNKTISFSEGINGWTSFKSFLPEAGFSVSGDYYSINGGELYQHNANTLRNNFYGVQYESKITFIFNDSPSAIKSFKGLNYEGTTSRIYQSDNDDLSLITNGWYGNKIETNKQNGKIPEFKEKEGKWFNFIQGTNNIIANLDPKEFSVQGLGVCSAVSVASGTHNTQYIQNVRIFSPESSPTLALVGGVYGFSGGNFHPTSETGNPAAIGQTHTNSGFTLNSAVKITGTAVTSLQYLKSIIDDLTPGETYTLSATVTITANPDNKAMGFSQRSGVSASARRTTTGVISDTFVATNSNIDLFKGSNVAGNIDNIAVAKTNQNEERYPKYIINNKQHLPTKLSKEIIINRSAGQIASGGTENKYFYIHPQIVNGQKWSVTTINQVNNSNYDVSVVETSDPGSLIGSAVIADGYINNGTWTSSTSHRWLHTNVVRITIPISGTMPAYDIVSLLKATVTPQLTQNV
tara:strand:- start:4389 stop:10721 length:6333 start_codon:yes stop_codon:yes gene_type:complete